MGVFLRGKIWWISYFVAGKQRFESSRSWKKRDAHRLLDARKGAKAEGRLKLPKTNAPHFLEFTRKFLVTIRHPNTQKRYKSSVRNLIAFFGNAKLLDITADTIEDFKEKRLSTGLSSATVNRDLAVLRRIMKLAAGGKFISEVPFQGVEFLSEDERHPHILTFEEEDRILAAAAPHIRALVVLILETGMRSGREALSLFWSDVDFVNDVILVRKSKTRAGERSIPMTDRCKTELLRWRTIVSSESSPYVFPNMQDSSKPMKDLRRSWAKAVKDAGLQHFWLYDLRHTMASRLAQSGVSPIFMEQIIGHTNARILRIYARANAEHRRDAIHKLADLRVAQASRQEQSGKIPNISSENQKI
jgi:integrase